MTSVTQVKALLAAGRDLDAKLLLAAYITQLAGPAGVKPIVVGGSAVDFYTAGTLESAEAALPMPLRASLDIDFLALDARNHEAARSLRQTLHGHGFLPTSNLPVDAARTWTHKALAVQVDVLHGELAGSVAHVRELEVDGGTIYLWGIEDAYWHYLAAAHATRHRHDYTRAQALLHVHGKKMDWPYLEGLAGTDGLEDLLAASRRRAPFEEAMAS